MKKLAMTALGLLASTSLYATTWQNDISSAGQIGNLGAGLDLSSPDAVSQNPAASVFFPSQIAAFSVLAQIDNSKFKGSVSATPTVTGLPASGISQGGQPQYIPAVNYAAPISPKWGFSFSMTEPMSFNSSFGANSPVTKYNLRQGWLNVYNFVPGVAYKISSHWIVGMGIMGAYARNFTSSNVAFANVSDTIGVRSSLTGWGYGWNLGGIWDSGSKLKVGLSYRSQEALILAGNSHGNMSSRARSNLVVPAETTLSMTQNISSKWTALASLAYTEWQNTHYTLRSVGVVGVNRINVFGNLKNNWRLAFAADYQASAAWTFKTGMSYSSSAMRQQTDVLYAPALAQYTFGLGANYQISDTLGAELGYAHVFVPTVSGSSASTVVLTNGNQQTYQLQGKLYQNSNILGLELDWKMI